MRTPPEHGSVGKPPTQSWEALLSIQVGECVYLTLGPHAVSPRDDKEATEREAAGAGVADIG